MIQLPKVVNVELHRIALEKRDDDKKHVATITVDPGYGDPALRTIVLEDFKHAIIYILYLVDCIRMQGHSQSSFRLEGFIAKHIEFIPIEHGFDVYIKALHQDYINLFRRHISILAPIHFWKLKDRTGAMRHKKKL